MLKKYDTEEEWRLSSFFNDLKPLTAPDRIDINVTFMFGYKNPDNYLNKQLRPKRTFCTFFSPQDMEVLKKKEQCRLPVLINKFRLENFDTKEIISNNRVESFANK